MKALKLAGMAVLFSLIVGSCGPVILTSRPGTPPPPWFYPNRLEVVRYVYFPEFHLYYDLSERMYLYWDSGIWRRVKTLPPRYHSLNLARTRYVRVRDYMDDNIGRYDQENNRTKGRSNLNTPPGHRNNK